MVQEENIDQLSDMLKDGWVVAGYSSCILAAGALVHNILLQKDSMLTNVTIGINAGNEIGRTVNIFAPKVQELTKKKGFFG